MDILPNAKEQQTEGMYRSYVLTWMLLVILTGATVAIYRLHLGNIGGIAALAIASCKAGLILLFFMHLRQEGRLLKAIFLLPVLIIAILVAFTFLDVWYR